MNARIVCLLILLGVCFSTGCTLEEPEVLVSTPIGTAVGEVSEQTGTPPRATVTGAAVVEGTESMPDNNIRVAEPGAPFNIGFGETVRLGGTNSDIMFEAIIQDGRCPVNGACLWEGAGEVKFVLTGEGGEKTDFILSIPGLVETPYVENSFVEEAGFLFKLLRLEPYPSDDSSVQPDAYQALLIFE